MSDFERVRWEILIGESSIVKPVGENWLVNGMWWWEPDTGQYYRYSLDTDTWDQLNVSAV